MARPIYNPEKSLKSQILAARSEKTIDKLAALLSTPEWGYASPNTRRKIAKAVTLRKADLAKGQTKPTETPPVPNQEARR